MCRCEKIVYCSWLDTGIRCHDALMSCLRMTFSCQVNFKPPSSSFIHSLNVLAFSAIFFHLCRSWMQSSQLYIFMVFKSFLTSFSHLVWDLPNDLIVMDFHSYTFFTILSSGILFYAHAQGNLTLWFNVVYYCFVSYQFYFKHYTSLLSFFKCTFYTISYNHVLMFVSHKQLIIQSVSVSKKSGVIFRWWRSSTYSRQW